MMTSIGVPSTGSAALSFASLRQLLARLRQRIERMQQAQREAYLVGAADIFELERRMRELERAGLPSMHR